MQSAKSVFVINGSSFDEWYPHYENVVVVNNWRDDMPTKYEYVTIINGLPEEDRPRTYENVQIIDRFSEDAPRSYKYVYVTNYAALKGIRALRDWFFPNTMFLRCPRCLREYEESKYVIEEILTCPNCGGRFWKIEAVTYW
jgi:DNA-directed RNA polymerase subunit RPC12/RpoP